MSSRRNALGWPYPRFRLFQEGLQCAAAGWFAEKGFPVHPRHPYILDSWESWPRNIIVPEVAAMIQRVRLERGPSDAFPLHKYAHHGLSSQAMLFNLAGPMMVAGDYTPLMVALWERGIHWPIGQITADLEHEDRGIFGEDSGQPTSIDLLIKGDGSDDGVFIECKLSEQEFGGCSVFQGGDCDGRNPAAQPRSCYLHHIGRSYWDLLGKYGFLNTAIGSDSGCILANHYQFFRELLFALESKQPADKVPVELHLIV